MAGQRPVDLEIWRISFCSTEDIERKPLRNIYVAVDDYIEAAKIAGEYDADFLDEVCEDGGGFMVSKIEYLGILS